ncbi:hypothetical protein RFI_19834 [Reticulomyxa filosa]|uniref:Uncharacterized protein n=1 Tax=Reticulomyxa filosa TaxID=46433 RepID=X6MUJ9_RETFI|nr:hypothetical protein RFI_19834 [Reticulomyxa filosa]|eukprot:ETO17489.1 hypothetical protein RFI_19834 [Reticulomyxa filosa]
MRYYQCDLYPSESNKSLEDYEEDMTVQKRERDYDKMTKQTQVQGMGASDSICIKCYEDLDKPGNTNSNESKAQIIGYLIIDSASQQDYICKQCLTRERENEYKNTLSKEFEIGFCVSKHCLNINDSNSKKIPIRKYGKRVLVKDSSLGQNSLRDCWLFYCCSCWKKLLFYYTCVCVQYTYVMYTYACLHFAQNKQTNKSNWIK